ncbi:MAG: hypothetical protein Q7S63_01900 [bacterium]|nr:hypothetical protein [bacterium]
MNLAAARALADEVRILPIWEKSDPERTAILVLPGEFQEFRVSEAVKSLWPGKGKHLWVAGTHSNPLYLRRDVLRIVQEEIGSGFDTTYIETAGWAANTPGQMYWAAALLKYYSTSVEHVIVATAAYHAPRCVLTLLKTMSKTGAECVISVFPILHENGPHSREPLWVEEEEKIRTYQKKGDVASRLEWDRYLLFGRPH